MANVPTLNEEDYFEIEEAVAATVRGRAFLRMRDRRANLVAVDQGNRMWSRLEKWFEGHDARRSSPASLDVMQRELMELRDHIERSRAEIAALAKDRKGNSESRLSGATEELYEIVASTERATSDILGAAEWIQERVAALPVGAEDRQAIEGRCMEIFTACSFQDITGQRVAKVVAAMAYIEQRVGAMVSMWSSEGDAAPAGLRTGQGVDGARAVPDDGEADLLNGPQLPGHGLGQDAVDALFGGGLQAPAPGSLPAPARPPAEPIRATAKPVRAKEPAPARKPPPPPAPSAPAAKLDQSAVDALFN